MSVRQPHWIDNAVVYQVYPRSFADGNGDGLGDLAGIISRIPYLVRLGVDAIWISPWYTSPWSDGGYDVADYRDIDPSFGSLADAQRLLDECHVNNIKVIIDIVPNHTSTEHPWFKEALASDPGSVARERYIFRPGNGEGPPNDWPSNFGGRGWSQTPDGEWFLHLFSEGQPDLNWRSEEVRAEFLSILEFWLDKGVDGIRVDVAHNLIKQPELPSYNGAISEDLISRPWRADHPFMDRPEVHAIYKEWRALAERYSPQRALIAEIWIGRPERLVRYVTDDEFHSAFNFDYLITGFDVDDLRHSVDEELAWFAYKEQVPSWVTGNHDFIRAATRYGRPLGAELAPAGSMPADLELGTNRALAMAAFTAGLPGNWFIYQGEELALPEVEDIPEALIDDPIWEQSGYTDRGRDGCRVPLPWTIEGLSYGFGLGGSWLPQPPAWAELSIESQELNEGSALQLHRLLVTQRRRLSIGGSHSFSWKKAAGNVLQYTRAVGDGLLTVTMNLGSEEEPLPGGRILVHSSGMAHDRLGPASTCWTFVDRNTDVDR